MFDMHKSPIPDALCDKFLTCFQSTISWPTSTRSWHFQTTMKMPEEKKEACIFKRGAQKLSKNVYEISGERTVMVKFGLWPKVGRPGSGLGGSWYTTLSLTWPQHIIFWLALTKGRMQLFTSPQPPYSHYHRGGYTEGVLGKSLKRYKKCLSININTSISTSPTGKSRI